MARTKQTARKRTIIRDQRNIINPDEVRQAKKEAREKRMLRWTRGDPSSVYWLCLVLKEDGDVAGKFCFDSTSVDPKDVESTRKKLEDSNVTDAILNNNRDDEPGLRSLYGDLVSGPTKEEPLTINDVIVSHHGTFIGDL